MRVAVVHYSTSPSKVLDDVVRALAMGIERQGHDVTVVNARTEGGKSLTPYGYIAVGTTAGSLMSKTVPEPLGAFLRSAGVLAGKRCYAFVSGGGLRKPRLLASLMKSMESEGMYLKKSDILAKPEEAEAVGLRLHIDRSVN